MKNFLLYSILCYYAITSGTSNGKVLDSESDRRYRFPDTKNFHTNEKLKEITDSNKDYSTFKSSFEKEKTHFRENFSTKVSNAGYKVGSSQNLDSDSPESNSLSMEVGKHVVKVSSVLLSKELKLKSKAAGNEISVNPKFSHVIDVILSDDNDRDEEKKQFVNENSVKSGVNLDLPINSQIPGELNSNFDLSNSSEHEEKTEISAEEDELVFIDSFEGSGEETFSSDDSKAGRLLRIFSHQNDTKQKCVTPKGEDGHCLRLRHCLLSNALNNFNIFLQYLCLIQGSLVGMCCPDNPVIEITHPDEEINEIKADVEIKQPPEGCGLNTKTRIVGGTISIPHEWSWMVALMRRNRFYCGGVIINNWYILTAAHCVMGIDVKDLTVRLGEYNFTQQNKHKEDISVAEIKRHSQFVTLTFQHDIALLKLRTSIRYSKFVGSICLPAQNARDYADVDGTVVGWGTVSFGGAASPVLRQVTVPVWKNEDCDQTYVLENIGDAFLCAGSPEKGEDACQGDSGGPLMTLNDGGRWEVIGIVSWGRRCGDPTYPGVYTRVTTYLDWIAENAV